MTTQTPEPLSDIPSVAIRQALADLRKCEADERYVIEMGAWHEPISNGRCEVCLAGAVVAQRNGVPLNQVWEPSIGEDMLDALNMFREGFLDEAFELLGYDQHPKAVPTVFSVRAYRIDRYGFYADMERMADMLEEAGY